MPKNLPSNVRRFEQLMYLSLALSLGEAALEWRQFVAAPSVPAFGVFAAFFYALAIFLIWQAARRRANWARWVWLILGILSLPASFSHFEPNPGVYLLAGILRVGGFLALAVALFFIFTGNARGWFETRLACSKCGAPQYSQSSAFCTRCGASHGAPAPLSGWRSLPFIVRLTVCALCVPVLVGVFMWVSVLATILSLFRP